MCFLELSSWFDEPEVVKFAKMSQGVVSYKMKLISATSSEPRGLDIWFWIHMKGLNV